MVLIKRPRNVNSLRAAAMLYGDWGTSKAYVAGIAFALAGYSSFYLILAMALLTTVVGINYIWICKYYPDGGGVYSSVRNRSRTLAVIGALLLTADYTVTASLSSLDAFHYLGFPNPHWWAIGSLAVLGVINIFGPRHSGGIAIFLAIPTVLVVAILLGASLPHLSGAQLIPLSGGFLGNWFNFVGIVLALSGVEAIANMTGVMKLDPGSTEENPSVHRTARNAILPVLIEVTVFTTALGLIMHAVPNLSDHTEDMVRFLGEYYIGKGFAHIVSIVFGLLLLSACNTAIVGMIAVFYMMSRDGEMPQAFSRLNKYGVPRIPLLLATIIPILVLLLENDLTHLAALYAIGVVGAITINLGATATNFQLGLSPLERGVMLGTFGLMAFIEATIAYEKRNALIFAVIMLTTGLAIRYGARTYERKRQMAVSERIPMPTPHPISTKPVTSILVAVRGVTDTLRFAIEEAKLRQATLYVLFIREIAVSLLPSIAKLPDDKEAQEVFSTAKALSNGLKIIPVYAVSNSPAEVILDEAATLGVDYLILGSSTRNALVKLLKGNVIEEVARQLPEEIKLIIYG
jgi:amino acid transporter/nucleotide-binding universal stress UspA family protein